MKPKELAVCAVMAALLIAAQFVLSFVAGVELVTVLLLTFSYVWGARCGAITAAAFSLFRCLIFGIYPNVLILYLLYYCPFAAIAGLMGKRPLPKALCPVLLILLSGFSLGFAVFDIPISVLYVTRVKVFLWLIFFISLALLALYIISLKRSGIKNALTVQAAAYAAFMTVIFTLMDDIITPLVMGYSREAAAGYFYGGFLAMLPQTVCAAVSVFLLFAPLRRIFEAALHGKFNSTEKDDKNEN